MRTSILIMGILILSSVCLAQDKADKGRLTPTPDPKAPFEVYIPKDLDDCFVELKKMLSPALIDEIKASPEDEMVMYHDGLGRWIRNNWALWAGSRLSKYFNEFGIGHPDDMSAIILTSFWRNLHSQPIKLDEQIKYYKKYWRDLKEKEASVSTVSSPALGFPLKAYGGKSIKLADYSGKIVVLAWWSLFCNPQSDCKDVLTPLVKIKQDFAANVEVIGLTGIHPPNQAKFNRLVKSAIAKYKINFPIVWDDEKFSNDVGEYEKFHYSSLPQVFVISRSGSVIKRIRGFDETALRETLTNALSAPKIEFVP